ncbi:MAG TPA: sugar phosphorylase [Anaerolineaceae bacterium]|nr:sugar phosphorylase [Anaerolineaceae bacterium]
MGADPSPEFREHLVFLYGPEEGQRTLARLDARLARVPPLPEPISPLDQRDAILITYGDQFQQPGEAPLRTLARFTERFLRGTVSGLHILPFFPYSSDDGFSVIDYRQVDPALGSWEEIHNLGRGLRLMFDAVINHISQRSAWFQAFLRDDPRCRDYFIALPPDDHTRELLARVFRPRALPLLTPFQTAAGEKWVWTTFSADQIDLNYADPDVLLEIVDILLEYVSHGARLIRLDAIAFLWKELGTRCLHLPQTHRVVRLFRSILDWAAPGVQIITETNVPHRDNISYFGNGRDEAQMVYNFALPPLVLHTFQTGSARALSEWAAGLQASLPSNQVTFFNFLASHDGVGVGPVRDILSATEVQALVDQALRRGGLVSSRTTPDGGQVPYELNISYFDAISDPNADEPGGLQVRRFLASQSILLALLGVPGIYIHSLLGSRNWSAGVQQTGRARTINREKFSYPDLLGELEQPGSRRSQVLQGMRAMLAARAASPAFDPFGVQRVLHCGDSVFTLLRASPDGQRQSLCLTNVTNERQQIHPSLPGSWRSLLKNQRFELENSAVIDLEPYEVLWLEK